MKILERQFKHWVGVKVEAMQAVSEKHIIYFWPKRRDFCQDKQKVNTFNTRLHKVFNLKILMLSAYTTRE